MNSQIHQELVTLTRYLITIVLPVREMDVYTPGRAYCLVAHYQEEGDNVLQLRVRAITMHFTNIVEGRTEYLLRIEFPNKLENQRFCGGEVEGVANDRVAFSPEDVCPDCRRSFRSVKLTIHESTNRQIIGTPISDGLINITGMSITINPLSDTSDPISSCTNSECRARGFD